VQLTIANTEVKLDTEGRFCLNDLHHAAGGEKKHQPSNFLRLDTTTALIAEMTTSSDMRNPLNKVNDGIGNGTYFCKELVYPYAMWISPSFHLKVIRTFDAIQSAPQAGSTIEALKVILKGMENTSAELAALKYEMGEIRESIAWLPTQPAPAQIALKGVIPTNPENVLYKKFVEICPNGNLKAWKKGTTLKFSDYCITKVIYQDHRPAPATWAIIAQALGFTRSEIKKHLQTNYKNCGFLALL